MPNTPWQTLVTGKTARPCHPRSAELLYAKKNHLISQINTWESLKCPALASGTTTCQRNPGNAVRRARASNSAYPDDRCLGGSFVKYRQTLLDESICPVKLKANFAGHPNKQPHLHFSGLTQNRSAPPKTPSLSTSPLTLQLGFPAKKILKMKIRTHTLQDAAPSTTALSFSTSKVWRERVHNASLIIQNYSLQNRGFSAV